MISLPQNREQLSHKMQCVCLLQREASGEQAPGPCGTELSPSLCATTFAFGQSHLLGSGLLCSSVHLSQAFVCHWCCVDFWQMLEQRRITEGLIATTLTLSNIYNNYLHILGLKAYFSLLPYHTVICCR